MVLASKSVPNNPFYSSVIVICLAPLLVVFSNYLCLFFFGQGTINEYNIDNIFHVFGGISISISIAGILWHSSDRGLVLLQDFQLFRFLVFGCLCFVVISWEILEYILFHPNEYMTYPDTIFDMICGLFGGVMALLLLRKPIL